MPSSRTCPEDHELLAVAAGEERSAELRDHVARCSRCGERVEQYRVEMQLLRARASEAPLAPSTVGGPASDQGPSDGRTHHSETTAPREAAEATAGHVSAPETDLGFDSAAGESDEPPLPAAIGKYLVIGRFPPTGQAEVYRVVHPEFRQERVIKLAKEPVGADGRSEIIDEGRKLAELDHPNMVRVYDIGFHEDRPYLVMEYVRGRSLKDYAGEHPLSPRQAAALVAKVCAAAEVAHRQGIVHRDIKHLNILIDEKNEPRLIDFGMARSRTFWSDDTARAGGTFAFMPPEQAHVESPPEQRKVGPRSDVFALGAVLYFLLTGKAPFEGGNWRESWDRARRCDFDRKALDDPKVPRDLRRICLKAMAADPAERFGSAEAFQKALRQHVARLKVLAALGGVCSVILLGGLLYTILPRPVSPRQPGSAAAPPAAPTARPASIPARVEPMKGRINLLVVKSKDGTRRRLRLENLGAVPVRAGDEIRIEAQVDRPAYLYLFWIGSEGKVSLLYPTKENAGSKPRSAHRKLKVAEVPGILDEVLEIPSSPPGLDTLVLLAREDSPLPPEEEAKLAKGWSTAPVPFPAGMNQAVWIEDGQEVDFETRAGFTRDGGDEMLTRGTPSSKTRQSDDPVLRIRALLSETMKPLGGYSQAVLFPNRGG